MAVCSSGLLLFGFRGKPGPTFSSIVILQPDIGLVLKIGVRLKSHPSL